MEPSDKEIGPIGAIISTLASLGAQGETIKEQVRAFVTNVLRDQGLVYQCEVIPPEPRLHKVDYVILPDSEREKSAGNSNDTHENPSEKRVQIPKYEFLIEILTEMGIDISNIDVYEGRKKSCGTIVKCVVVHELGKTILVPSDDQVKIYIFFDTDNHEIHAQKKHEELTEEEGKTVISFKWRSSENLKTRLKQALQLDAPTEIPENTESFFNNSKLVRDALLDFFNQSQNRRNPPSSIYDLTNTHINCTTATMIPGLGLTNGDAFLEEAAAVKRISDRTPKKIIDELLRFAGFSDILDDNFFQNKAHLEAHLIAFANAANKPLTLLSPSDQCIEITCYNGQKMSFKRFIARAIKALTGESRVTWAKTEDLRIVYDHINIFDYKNFKRYFETNAWIVQDLRAFARNMKVEVQNLSTSYNSAYTRLISGENLQFVGYLIKTKNYFGFSTKTEALAKLLSIYEQYSDQYPDAGEYIALGTNNSVRNLTTASSSDTAPDFVENYYAMGENNPTTVSVPSSVPPLGDTSNHDIQ